MTASHFKRVRNTLTDVLLSVPVRIKMAGIMILPILILGFVLNYWVRTGLSDWLSYLLDNERVAVAMQVGSRSVLVVSILAAIASILLTYVLMYILTQPLLELRQTALKVVNGKLASRARVWADDEIGDVAQTINQMLDQLVESQEELTLANRRLAAMNQVAIAAVKDLDLHEVLKASMQEMLQIMGLDTGWVFLRIPEKNQFELACYSTIEAAQIGVALLTNESDLCACQDKLLNGDIEKAAEIHQCHRIARVGSTASARYHISIPLHARGQQFGMINLLCKENESPTAENIDLLAAIGAQVSEIAANAWLHRRLLEKEAARQTLLNALVNAQEGERSRLARELHDGPGQTLTSLLMRLKAIGNKTQAKLIRANLDELCDFVAEIIEQVREISYLLRPAALEELGLATAIQTIAQRIGEQSGFNADFDNALNREKLPLEIEITLFRIAQESLTNIVKHAQAKNVHIQLFNNDDNICMRIKDDGIGFNPEVSARLNDRPHLGLVSMQERASILNGDVKIISGSGDGTEIEVTIPYLEK